MDGVTIRRVSSKKDLVRFIKFPWKIYARNGYWVPPLISDKKKLLDRARNPFYQHADMELFLAEKSGELVGRVGAIVNHLHNSFHGENIGFFGFFESVNDRIVSAAMFDTARDWLRSKGVTAMRGPASPSMNDECGLLIEGFEESPTVMMPYNPPYYADLFEAYGLRKVMDLYAYALYKDRVELGKILRLAEVVRRRQSLQIRSIDMKNFRRDVGIVKEIYNKAWSSNWGFVPLTDEEIDFLADDLKKILDPDFASFAEVNGKDVGFSLALPDINQVLKRIPSGRLFPFGLLKFLLYRTKIDNVRLIITGVIKEYQRRGIDAVLYSEILHRAAAKGIYRGEASWILETNKMMSSGLDAMNAVCSKTYRMYEMSIN